MRHGRELSVEFRLAEVASIRPVPLIARVVQLFCSQELLMKSEPLCEPQGLLALASGKASGLSRHTQRTLAQDLSCDVSDIGAINAARVSHQDSAHLLKERAKLRLFLFRFRR